MSEPRRRCVFLGSNLTILAKQFYSVLSESCPLPTHFTYSMLSETRDSQLKIGLPQQLIKRPRSVDLLVLDEAQNLWQQVERNSNSMLAQVLRICQPKMILLLTGSPSYFTARSESYRVHYLSFEDVPEIEHPVFSKVSLDLVSVSQKFDVNEVLTQFFETAQSRRDDLSQVAIVARNVAQAVAVKHCLESRYKKRCLISTSKHDADSVNLHKFMSGEYDCLVTVNRIVAGWSYPNLTCILDLVASRNINRSFQLFSRLLRVKEPSTVKLYCRVCVPEQYQREARFLYKMKSLLKRRIFAQYTRSKIRDDGLLEAA